MKTLKKHLIFVVVMVFSISACDPFVTNPSDLEDVQTLLNKPDQNMGDIIIPNTTKVIAEQDLSNITSYDDDKIIISNKSSIASTVKQGDVLMFGVSKEAPYGALKKVESVTTEGSSKILNVSQATLPEAISDGTISANILLDGNQLKKTSALKGVGQMESTEFSFQVPLDHVNLYSDNGVNVWVDGVIEATAEISLDIDIEMFEVTNVTATTVITRTEDLHLSANAAFSDSRSIEIARYVYPPIVIYGVVIVPEVSIKVGFDGEISCEATTGITRTRQLTNTIKYDAANAGNEWSATTSNDVIYNEWIVPNFNARANLKVYAGPKIDLMIFGVVGPTFSVQGYLELKVDIEDNPWWEINAGLQGTLGVEAGIFGFDAAWEKTLNIDQIPLQDAGGSFLYQANISGTIRDFETETPLEEVKVSLYTVSSTGRITLDEVFTDAEGKYSITHEAGEGYMLDFTKNEYLTSTYSLGNLTNDDVRVVDVSLSRSSQTGWIQGLVKDAVDSNPIPGVQVRVFKNGGGEVLAGVTDNNGEYRFEVPEYDDYFITYSKPDYMETKYSGVQVVQGQTKYLQAILYINNAYLENGDFGGIISNATTGNPEEGVSIALRANINQTTGNVIATTQTASNGSYIFTNIPAGQYTLELSKNGFITNYTPAICIGNQSTSGQNGTISPEIPENEVRIILTWGEYPSDLDSHLTGPAEGNSRFHVCYYSKTYNDINLDVDDVTSYGPETIEIPDIQNGSYSYYVHDYSNRNSQYSNGLAQSGAKVIVFLGNKMVGTYDVPNIEGTLWKVFEINNRTLVPINTMGYESAPDNIAKSSGNNIEYNMFENLPKKK